MAPPYKTYTKSMSKRFDLYATWPLGSQLELGDIVVFETKYKVKRLGNVRQKNVEFDVREDAAPMDLDHQSAKGVSFNIGVEGDITAPGADVKTKVGYQFSRSGSFVFNAKTVTFPEIENLIKLWDDIKGLGVWWQSDWKVVTKLAVAESIAVMISSSSDGKVELAADGNITGVPNIADAGLGFDFTHKSDMETAMISQEVTQPLFEIHAVKRRGLFRDATDPADRDFGVVRPADHWRDEDEEDDE
jgi:hypothetical protein